MLYTLSSSPWQCDIKSLLRMLQINDDLILIQDGILAAVNGNNFVEMFLSLPVVLSVLKEDMEARGFNEKDLIKINVITYNDFVKLAVKQHGHINW